MSYILEALRKAEQQREIGQVPGIGSEHERSAAVSFRGRWLWVIVAVLLVNAGLLVYALWPGERPVVVATADSVAIPPQPGHAPVPEVDSSPRPPAAALQAVPVTPPLVQAAPVDPRSVETEQASAVLRPLTPLPVPARQPSAVRTPATEPSVAIPVPAPVVRPQPQDAPSSANDNLPVWPQVSAQLFQQMRGGLRLDVHVYSDQPHERFVLINMQKYNEGQRLKEGPLLDEITSEGVILSYQSQRFRVRSQ